MKLTKTAFLASAILLFLSFAVCAQAADEIGIQRMATCQDSWLEWKSEPARLNKLAENIRSNYTEEKGTPYLVPKSTKTVFGLPLVQLYPDSVGMGVGFSVMVGAGFEETKKILEKEVGKSFTHCEKGEGMLSCELEIGEKKTIFLLSDENDKGKKTLFGCYYYYEK